MVLTENPHKISCYLFLFSSFYVSVSLSVSIVIVVVTVSTVVVVRVVMFGFGVKFYRLGLMLEFIEQFEYWILKCHIREIL